VIATVTKSVCYYLLNDLYELPENLVFYDKGFE